MTTSVRAGSPRVIVPVLSSTMVLSLWAVSSDSADRIRMPCSAPLPVETMIDSGCRQPERARAGDDQHRHGGDERERERRFGPTTNQMAKVAMAMNITAGTK